MDYSKKGKIVLDTIVAATALTILAPFMVVIALAIYSTDRKPIIYKQWRIGKNGVKFMLYKFRSMPIDTAIVPSHKLKEVKISKVGRLIRRFNIDEIPQLINVLEGKMSIVGPRPSLPEQSELIELRRRNGSLEAKPGITGLAQVNSYNGMSDAEKSMYDCKYTETINLANDLKILIKTLQYLMRKPPVY